jgi:hypothetical protein
LLVVLIEMEAQTGGKDMIGLPLRLTYLFLGRKSGRSPFLIQEMVDLIIECLSQSSADLHSCALVSKSWVTKAQSHIFCTVSFSPYEGVEKYEQCLMGLQTYPHLSRFVRHIIISVNSRWLAPVSSIAFPSLQEITIRSGSSRYQIVQLLPIMMETVPTIQAYLRSPSVKRVNFNGYFSIAVLDTYLDDCSSNITSLGLDLRHIAHPVETTAVTTRRQPKINLSHLALLNSQIMSHWLLRPRCAFAVSHLRSVETDARTWFRLQGSLAPSLPSLTSLVLTNCVFPINSAWPSI